MWCCIFTLCVSQLQDMNTCLVGSGLLLGSSTSWPTHSVSPHPYRLCVLSFQGVQGVNSSQFTEVSRGKSHALIEVTGPCVYIRNQNQRLLDCQDGISVQTDEACPTRHLDWVTVVLSEWRYII